MTISEYFKVHTVDLLQEYDRIYVRPLSYYKYDHAQTTCIVRDRNEFFNLPITQKVRTFGYAQFSVMFHNFRDVRNKVDGSVQLHHAHIWGEKDSDGCVNLCLCLYVSDSAYAKLAFACRKN